MIKNLFKKFYLYLFMKLKILKKGSSLNPYSFDATENTYYIVVGFAKTDKWGGYTVSDIFTKKQQAEKRLKRMKEKKGGQLIQIASKNRLIRKKNYYIVIGSYNDAFITSDFYENINDAELQAKNIPNGSVYTRTLR